MRKFCLISAWGLAAIFQMGHALSASCIDHSKAMDLRPPLGYTVAGIKRTYFYTAPKDNCINKNLFASKDDFLIAYSQSGKWSYVSFTSKNGDIHNGWVKNSRLKFIGTEGYTEPKDMKFYKRAAKEARSKKLGSPFGDLNP